VTPALCSVGAVVTMGDVATASASTAGTVHVALAHPAGIVGQHGC